MRKVVVDTFLTLDGVMQGPGGADEDRAGGFEHGGWQGPYFDDVAGQAIGEGLENAGGYLLGRVTYEIFAAYWPNPTDEVDREFARVMNEMPKFVASRTLQPPLEWENSTLIEGDVAEGVKELKAGDGKELHVIGSGKLAQSLADAGLVDEWRLMVHPIVLGSGKRLFEEGGPRIPLKLADQKTTPTGVLILTYVPG